MNNEHWHTSITSDLRNHLIRKLIQGFFPTSDSAAIQNLPLDNNLVIFARNIENDMYEKAKSRAEYYYLLAEKIYKLQSELEKKRREEQKVQHSNGTQLNEDQFNNIESSGTLQNLSQIIDELSLK